MRTLKLVLLGVGGLLAVIVATIVGVGFFLSPQDQLESADMIVAISGGETQQRAREAVRLYQQGYAPKLVFSGAAADKNGPSNAMAMRTQALEAGVPAEDIVIEEDSATTAENAIQVGKIVQAQGADSLILVTSPYHQRRAFMNFRQVLGPEVTIVNHSAVDSAWRKSSWWHQAYTLDLTISELQKTIYVYSTKPEAQQ